MRSNSKAVREQVRKHILECVHDHEDKQFDTFEDAAVHLRKEFERVANHPYNMQRIPNHQERFADYMMGVPFYFEYAYAPMKEKLVEWLGASDKKFSDEKVAHMYYYLIFKEVQP